MMFGFNGGEVRIVPDGTVRARQFRWEDSQGNARDDYSLSAVATDRDARR